MRLLSISMKMQLKQCKIDLYNTSETRSNQKSFGLNYQKTGKELMSQDEITVMDGSKCIFQLRGVRPFLSDKFDITKHKNYKLLEDYDKKKALIAEIQIYEDKQPNGQWLKSITFKLPIIDEDLNIGLDNNEQVECVALLVKV